MPRARLLHQLVTTVPAEYADAVSSALMEAGATAVEEAPGARGARLRAFGEEADVARFARALAGLFAEEKLRARISIAPAPRASNGWETAFIASLEPVRVSRTLVIAPSTFRGPLPPGRVLRLEPAVAFGHGDHPTTVLAANAAERLCRGGAPSVLDVGTGTGVLAVVAALSGASRVIGVDVDARAVAAATANARLNGVSSNCRFVKARPGGLGARFSVVLANLDLRLHEELAGGIAAAVAPGGALAVTGFLREHARDVERLYGALGLIRAGRAAISGDWALLTLRAGGSSGPPRRARPATRRGTTRTPRSR